MEFSIVKLVNLPILKKIDEVPLFARFEAPMYTGKTLKAAAGETAEAGKKRQARSPATLAEITDMETGENALIIVNQVLRENLNDTYPADGYVGKTFRIVQHSREGKNYKTYSIAEVALTLDADKANDPEPAPAKPAARKGGRK